MRRIHTQDGAPETFLKWLSNNDKTIKFLIDSPDKTGNNIWSFFRENKTIYEDLKKTLIQDQGFICCYCGKRIDVDIHTSIEHLNPKTIYKELTLNFDNLLASCKGGSTDQIHIVKKGESLEVIANQYGVSIDHIEEVYVNVDEIKLFRKKYDLEDLSEGDRIVIFPKLNAKEQHCDTKKDKYEIAITPLQDNCSDFFVYNPTDGKIQETSQNHSTLNTLGLNNNRYLNQLRKKVIDDSFILKQNLIEDFGDSPNFFEQNRQLLIKKLNELPPNGIFEPFCFITSWSLEN